MMKWLVLFVTAALLGVAATIDDRIDDRIGEVSFNCLEYDSYSVDNPNCVAMLQNRCSASNVNVSCRNTHGCIR